MSVVNGAKQQLHFLGQPPEGWLAVMRKALGMSGAEVATRLSVNRNAIYQGERNEREGAITINQMQKLAEAMGGRFVYAVVPCDSVEDMIRHQARRKAEARIRRVSVHMALEQQALPSAQTEHRIEELTEELIREMPSDFWKAK